MIDSGNNSKININKKSKTTLEIDRDADPHDHTHNHDHDHGNTGFISKIFHSHSNDHHIEDATEEGMRVLKISFVGLMVTAIIQVFVVVYTNSVALMADTIHNFSDAFTAIPLWIAYSYSRKQKSKRYTYGYGRLEDLAGLFILAMIAFSAVIVFKESIERFVDPQPVNHLGVLAIASIVGFLGNEIVAKYRINAGKRINSEALIADGYHSRIDGIVSLSVLIGVLGAYAGYPIIDPIVGLLIGLLILKILKDITPGLWLKLNDGVQPHYISQIEDTAISVEGVSEIVSTRARWCGRKLMADIDVIIDKEFTLLESNDIIISLKEQLISSISQLEEVTVQPLPCNHTN